MSENQNLNNPPPTTSPKDSSKKIEPAKNDEEDSSNDPLNDCFPSNVKLNLTCDEKEELEDLDDEVNEADFQNLLHSLQDDETTKNLFSTFNSFLQNNQNAPASSQFSSNFENMFGNFTEKDGGNNIDNFTDEMLKGMLKKEVIYEPLLDAKTKLEELFAKKPQNEEENKKREQDQKVYALICDLINEFNKPDFESKESQERIMVKFETLHDLGGLPTELMKEGAKDLPGMGDLGKTLGNCMIF